MELITKYFRLVTVGEVGRCMHCLHEMSALLEDRFHLHVIL